MSDPRETSLSRHLSTLPKLDKTHFVSTFVRDQRVHAKSHSLEGRTVASQWDHASVVTPNERKLVPAPESDRDAFGTPVLKPRVPARIIQEAARVPLKDHKNDQGHVESIRNDRLSHPTARENKRKRTGSTKRSVPNSNQQSLIQNKTLPKESVRGLGVEDEQASRRRERRDRKRAKRAIINPPRSSDVENEPMSNAKAPRNAKKNSRIKIPTGFALMHGFTATNVGRSRLTIKSSAGVFNKGKASANTLTKHQRAKKGRQGAVFSELGFLNNGDQGRRKLLENSISIHSSLDTDSHSRSSDQSPEERPKKFVITNRRRPKSRRVESAKTPHCNSPKNSGDSAISVDRLSISHTSQARSDTDPLPKERLAGSIMWDIETETASLLSSAAPFEKRSMILEIGSRRWNGSPANDLAPPNYHYRLAASPRLTAEKGENLIETKNPSSLGPSQSASQHGRCSPRVDDLLPKADGCSKYFISQVTQKTQKEENATFEEQAVTPAVKVSMSPSKVVEEIRPANYPDLTSTWERISEPESQPLDQLPNAPSPLRSLDKEVAHHGLVPQHHTDLEVFPSLQLGSTEWPAFCSQYPVLTGVEPENIDVNNRFGGEPTHAAGWDLEHSVEYLPRDRCLWPSVDYHDDSYAHYEHDIPEDLVPCRSYGGYNASMLDLCYVESEGSRQSDCIREHDLEAEGGYMINHLLSFSDNGERELDNNEDPRYEEEYVGNENLELDDAWNQRYSDIHDESASSDPDNSCLGNSEPVHSAAMFSQGRALLLGGDGTMTGTANQIRTRPPLSLVEADVAKTLRNHWLPQKL